MTLASQHRSQHAPAGPSATRILVVGNSRVFIGRVSAALESDARLRIGGTAYSAGEASDKAVLLRPDVCVIDLNHRFEFGGTNTAQMVLRVCPSVGWVFISPFTDTGHLAQFPVSDGKRWSYVLAESLREPGLLASAVNSASWGIQFIDPKLDYRQVGTLDGDLELIRSAFPARLAGELGRNRWLTAVKRFRLDEV